MIIILSPSKTLDVKNNSSTKDYSQPRLLDHSSELIRELRKLSPNGIASLMDVSRKIASENFERFASWTLPFSRENAKQSLFTFKGDVYAGLHAETFTQEDVHFAQKHLRILSGLYGVLRPLDLMQAYRLEMGLRFKNQRGKDLYEFWGELITQTLNQDMQESKSDTLVNLASLEYFRAVIPEKIQGRIITPVFKEDKPGGLKIIGLFAKKARGSMSRFIIKNRITEPEQIKTYSEDGYEYADNLSSEKEWIFVR
jgi:uncharacterized protein